jgi:hypothetical protein
MEAQTISEAPASLCSLPADPSGGTALYPLGNRLSKACTGAVSAANTVLTRYCIPKREPSAQVVCRPLEQRSDLSTSRAPGFRPRTGAGKRYGDVGRASYVTRQNQVAPSLFGRGELKAVPLCQSPEKMPVFTGFRGLEDIARVRCQRLWMHNRRPFLTLGRRMPWTDPRPVSEQSDFRRGILRGPDSSRDVTGVPEEAGMGPWVMLVLLTFFGGVLPLTPPGPQSPSHNSVPCTRSAASVFDYRQSSLLPQDVSRQHRTTH